MFPAGSNALVHCGRLILQVVRKVKRRVNKVGIAGVSPVECWDNGDNVRDVPLVARTEPPCTPQVAWSGRDLGHRPFFPAALDRGGDVHRLAIFRHRPAGDIDAALLQDIDDIVV